MRIIAALLVCAAAPSVKAAASTRSSLRGTQGGDEAAIITSHQLSGDPYDGTTFSGDGTYYGETSNGNCAIRSPIPSMYSGMIPVALNNDQYGGSEMCGACIEGEGSGKGAGADPITGPFKAYVMDKCPECSHGDLDFSKSGDGRWDISWRFVPCPDGSSKPSEGSHEYYLKIQPRGAKTPVVELKVDGAAGTAFDDDFFEPKVDGAAESPFDDDWSEPKVDGAAESPFDDDWSEPKVDGAAESPFDDDFFEPKVDGAAGTAFDDDFFEPK